MTTKIGPREAQLQAMREQQAKEHAAKKPGKHANPEALAAGRAILAQVPTAGKKPVKRKAKRRGK